MLVSVMLGLESVSTILLCVKHSVFGCSKDKREGPSREYILVYNGEDMRKLSKCSGLLRTGLLWHMHIHVEYLKLRSNRNIYRVC